LLTCHKKTEVLITENCLHKQFIKFCPQIQGNAMSERAAVEAGSPTVL
jgi:hypothetical protein